MDYEIYFQNINIDSGCPVKHVIQRSYFFLLAFNTTLIFGNKFMLMKWQEPIYLCTELFASELGPRAIGVDSFLTSLFPSGVELTGQMAIT